MNQLTEYYNKQDKMEELKKRMHESVLLKDAEITHKIADEILCEALEVLGYKELVKEFKEVEKWYS